MSSCPALLSDQELQSIYRGEEPDRELIGRMYSEEYRESEEVINEEFRQLALSHYYRRRMRNGKLLTEEELKEVENLHSPDAFYGFTLNLIGEFAMYDVLTVDQCRRLLGIVREGRWAYNQLLARLTLSEDTGDIPAVVEKLIGLNSVWSVLEILERGTIDELKAIRVRMTDLTVLSRYNRHLVREEIDKKLREDAKRNKKIAER